MVDELTVTTRQHAPDASKIAAPGALPCCGTDTHRTPIDAPTLRKDMRERSGSHGSRRNQLRKMHPGSPRRPLPSELDPHAPDHAGQQTVSQCGPPGYNNHPTECAPCPPCAPAPMCDAESVAAARPNIWQNSYRSPKTGICSYKFHNIPS